jgi:hypothetical protein
LRVLFAARTVVRVAGVYDLDHFLPITSRADLALDYENLLYACATCNASKGGRKIPDPLTVLTNPSVRVTEDGTLHATTKDAARLIKLLGLNSKQAIEFRLLWIGVYALAAQFDPDLFRRMMGYPSDLPNWIVAASWR